ncbi:hypothetical protein DY000_02014122 [Brassica cretica]|uniref:Uncharacterized protein n=1 Tax=Brassica cretica TaxID=69181 RepID=A0ABQ7D101_BRACR|nr:hypothetical protein DY000_02014122 [Brassica cretica]
MCGGVVVMEKTVVLVMKESVFVDLEETMAFSNGCGVVMMKIMMVKNDSNGVDSSAQGGDSFLTEKSEEIESKVSSEESQKTESSTDDVLFGKEVRHKDGDLLAHVLTAPKELSTKEESKDYEEDWKKAGKREYVNTRLGNGVVRKVSHILGEGIFGDRVKENITLSKNHSNENRAGVLINAVPGEELQDKEKWKEVSGFVEVREESPKGHWKRKKNCQNSIEGGQWRGTYWSCREIPWRGLKTRIDVKVGETTIHSSPDETGSGQRSSSLEMQRKDETRNMTTSDSTTCHSLPRNFAWAFFPSLKINQYTFSQSLEVKYFSLIIVLASSLLLVLQDLEQVHALGCSGIFLNGNSSYFQNRHSLFSTLASKVVANGGFYNASLGKNPNRVHALVLCARGYEQQSCISCVEKVTQEIQTSCPNRMNSFHWDNDDGDHVSCLVRTSNQSTFKNFQLVPAAIYPSPLTIEPSKDMTLFSKQWQATVNRTVQAATEAKNISVLQYYSAVEAEFTEFPNVYMLMQCTPDITSQDCKICLEKSGTYFKKQFWGRQGGEVSRPSCVFRWDLYAFHGAFDNITRVPVLPGGQGQGQPPSKDSSRKGNKGRSIGNGGIISIVVPALINILVFIGLIKLYTRRRQFNNIINDLFLFLVGTAEYSDGQLMLRFDLGMILMATNDFSSDNTLGQGGFGTVYKGILPNGQEIAVKRLTKGSGQGDMEFKNEVSLLTRLQHRNLVKLLGFCNEGDEEVLVYEFVPNSSLDHFIFEGIARGLLYLDEDCQLKIIHRDLKASNILLDAEMNPKVADFGTARLFNTDETRAETRRIAGTRPEIIIDPFLVENPSNEIIKLIQIGLLCVQENASKRPTMSSVIVWLGSETIKVPLPKAPAFTSKQSQSEDGIMSISNVCTELSSR